jgi:hypothetical protein
MQYVCVPTQLAENQVKVIQRLKKIPDGSGVCLCQLAMNANNLLIDRQYSLMLAQVSEVSAKVIQGLDKIPGGSGVYLS